MPNKTWFTAKAANSVGEIAIYDEIGAWGVSANDFRDALSGLGDVSKIDLRINSPGGDVFAGLAIFNMLARHKAEKVVTVDGIAASMASVIAMAGDSVVMPENAMMMIHDPSGLVMGTAQDMRELADAMDKIKLGMISAYRNKSGMDEEGIAKLMTAETWLTAKEAQMLGFADVVEQPVKIAASFDLSKFKNPPAPAGEPRGQAAQNLSQQEDQSMTDAEKAAAEKAEAEMKAKAEAEAKAKAEADAKALADAQSDERKRAADIVAACQIAGKPEKAVEFVGSEKSLSEVVAALKAEHKPADEMTARHSEQPEAKASDMWAEAAAKTNAMFGVKR